jgi:hypothetical protein
MPTSVFSDSVNSAFDEAAKQASADEVHRIKVTIDQQEVEIQSFFLHSARVSRGDGETCHTMRQSSSNAPRNITL